MRASASILTLVAGAVLAIAQPALAGFGGQTILGPLGPNSIVSGNTIGATDDNDGFTSGDHIFFIWEGGDDVWALQWPGGNIVLDMAYDNTACDVDLFLYTPDSLDDSGNYSIGNSGLEHIEMPGAAAGTYYIVVDSEKGKEGEYRLSVGPVPSPATAVLLGGGLLTLGRRSRRA